MKPYSLIFTALCIFFILSGCATTETAKNSTLGRIDTLGFPAVAMSEVAYSPPQADFIFVLPRGWFFLDLQQKGGSHVLAVATNADYTLQFVLATVRSLEDLEQIYQEQRIVGIARADFAHRYRKTGGVLQVLGKFTLKKVGTKEFGCYQYTNDYGATVHRVAVFRTAQGNFYSITLVQSSFAATTIPSQEECERVFDAVLKTLDYQR